MMTGSDLCTGSTGEMEAPWVVVRFRAQYLAKVRYNVECQGAEIYVPMAMLRVGKNRVLVPRPLFPGYAFVRHPDGQWMFLRGTFGVLDIIMGTGENPARLPDDEIKRIRAREGPDGIVRLASSEFSVGEKVRVEHGAVSLDGIVDGMAGRDRVYVLLELLGAPRRTEVDVRNITA